MTIRTRPTPLYPSAASVADLYALLVREQERCLEVREDQQAVIRAGLRHGVLQEVREWITDWYEAEEQHLHGAAEEWERLKGEGYDENELREMAGGR